MDYSIIFNLLRELKEAVDKMKSNIEDGKLLASRVERLYNDLETSHVENFTRFEPHFKQLKETLIQATDVCKRCDDNWFFLLLKNASIESDLKKVNEKLNTAIHDFGFSIAVDTLQVRKAKDEADKINKMYGEYLDHGNFKGLLKRLLSEKKISLKELEESLKEHVHKVTGDEDMIYIETMVEELAESKRGTMVPPYYICSISGKIMEDPFILLESGNSYDKENIEKWITQFSFEPITKESLTKMDLGPNNNLKMAIKGYQRVIQERAKPLSKPVEMNAALAVLDSSQHARIQKPGRPDMAFLHNPDEMFGINGDSVDELLEWNQQQVAFEGVSMDELLKKAAEGDAAAQYELGNCYFHGKGVGKDSGKATFWYTMAAAAQGFVLSGN